MAKRRIVLPLTFLPGKPDLDADSQPVIDRVVVMMQQHPEMMLDIEGHTDNTGDPRYNEILSKQRAVAVREMLIEGHIEKKRLTAVGMGGSQPLAKEETSEGREKNRRIELVLRKNALQKESPEGDSSQKIAPRTTATAREVAQRPTPRPDATEDDSTFHAPAPDGVNYYPKSDTSASSASR